MKARTAKALAGTRYILQPEKYPAIVGAVDYAAQNPGLEYGNYSSGPNDQAGRKAYCAEAESIRKDWARVIQAVQEADKAGVSDQDVIQAAPSAFSGRFIPERISEVTGLTIWDYCTGQYWPTEYRKAVASVLEYATHAVLQPDRLNRCPCVSIHLRK